MITIGNLRPAKVVIDRAAINHNIENEMKRLPANTEMFAVVKANAYGHGLVEVAKVALNSGATGLCVALLDEAMTLRASNITAPILVLGVVAPHTASIAAANNIAVPAPSLEWLQAAQPVLAQNQNLPKLKIHMAIDSGMGRIGFTQPRELKEALDYLADVKDFEVEGVFTHFSTADNPDSTYFNQQVDRFHEFLGVFDFLPKYVHVSNSATSLWHDACNGNMIRFGVALYGLNPSGKAIRPPYELQPAMSIESELVFVKQVKKGESIGYGATYQASEDEWIGTIPIGYADGWLRRLQGFHVLVDGQYCEMVGRVCMDQFMIRLPKEYSTGTKVTLVGKNGDQTISLQDVADYSNTIHYEIACDLQVRLPRVYIH